jgi:hypothetical protein
MLLDIKAYMQERKHVSLRDIALHFDADPEAVRGMLDKWIEKGRVIKCSTEACGGCASKCATAQQEEAYEWVERPRRFIQIRTQ